MRSWSEPKSTWPAFTWQQAVYTKNATEYDEFMHADRKMNTYTVKACSDGSMVRDVFHSTPFFFGFIGQLMFVTIDNINFKIRSKSVYFESWCCLLELTPLLTLWWLFWHCLSMTEKATARPSSRVTKREFLGAGMEKVKFGGGTSSPLQISWYIYN